MTCWPSAACSSGATARASTSATPPGGNGATMRTGLDGKVCAAAAEASRTPRMPNRTLMRFIVSSLDVASLAADRHARIGNDGLAGDEGAGLAGQHDGDA